MEIREALLELINSDTINFSHMNRAIEKLVFVMLEDYLKSQKKRLIIDRKFDMILPDGIDDEEECLAVEIKMYRNSQIVSRVLYD